MCAAQPLSTLAKALSSPLSPSRSGLNLATFLLHTHMSNVLYGQNIIVCEKCPSLYYCIPYMEPAIQ